MGCTVHMEGVEDTWNLGDVLSTALFSTLTILARARDEMFRTEQPIVQGLLLEKRKQSSTKDWWWRRTILTRD